jgi:hypothetical protein
VAAKKLKAKLQRDDRGTVSFVVPEDVVESFRSGKRPPVQTTINGYPYRTRVAVYGGVSYVMLRKDVLAGAGVDAGDSVNVTIDLDQAPREVEIPPELTRALNADRAAQAAFEKLSYTHRKEWARWIAEARREETRRRRVARAVEMLRAGRKEP